MLYPQAETPAEVAANLAAIRERMARACARAGRDPAGVRLLPVSKTVDQARIRFAHAAGYRAFGENKVQEVQLKQPQMADLGDVEWIVIGHLQTNKAKVVARLASEFQALDSLRLAEALEQRLRHEQRQLDVLVQINTSDEPSKYGLHPDVAASFIQQLQQFPSLRVKGLMTLAIQSADPERVRACFVRLRQLRDRLLPDLPAGMRLDELSMGMSGDFEIAIEEGATVVRVGQAVFGARALPHHHYWPSQQLPEEQVL
ncbi:YggS family pyridoxal phosphate enzyme [Jeongeupia chitinilytica]|uniref:Pyridoxal phosphate homeostasis protein n=2 Tax=Jeongeupia chitinilytica TaxID=1041641 RepID=A0ABQ3H3T1_9NEIS|nr:YggS family pyridoxal phosphate enzyme [Jeongeupia chitinilytica]